MSMESDTILLRSGTDVVSVLDNKKLGEQGSPVRCKVVVPHASDQIDGKCLVDLDSQGTLFVAVRLDDYRTSPKQFILPVTL